MPVFETAQNFSGCLPEVFDFFTRPANLLLTYPPELHLHLEEAPEQLSLGCLLRMRGRRWGVPHRGVTEITAFESNALFVEEQRQGPFRRWVHEHRFEALGGGGVRVSDRIDFEPPGGLLGLRVTVAFVLRDLEWVFSYRRQKLGEIPALTSDGE